MDERSSMATSRDLQAEEANKATIARAFAEWAAGTGGPYALLADDATWTIVGNSPASRRYDSRQEFLDRVIDPFNARMASPLVPTVRALFAEGDWVIALFDASGTARDGKPYNNTYSWYLRLRDGKIVEAIAFFDTIEFTDFWERITP
jgi:ketosteroid isomerase-like protein